MSGTLVDWPVAALVVVVVMGGAVKWVLSPFMRRSAVMREAQEG